jgi:hypothetical protein
MSPDNRLPTERREALGPKPYIKAVDTSVFFDGLEFNVYVGSDYNASDLDLTPQAKEGLTPEQINAEIKRLTPWVGEVLDYTVGAWGNATFKPSGTELIDEVGPTHYWTFPEGSAFKDDAKLPPVTKFIDGEWVDVDYRIGYPREYRGSAMMTDEEYLADLFDELGS